MGIRGTILLSTMAVMGFAAAASATPAAPASYAHDPMIEGARQCTQQFPVQEREQGIPNHLLAAISSTESGRWHKGLGMALPWPWTINVEGKGYYYDSKAEAIAHTAQFIKQGARSIDVGCMQVNLKHHAKAFRTLNDAFEPATNVAYAAKFLRNNYNDLGDWIKATAAYHSRTDYYGRQYLARIEKSWNRIVTKVQQARANQGLAPQQVAQQNFDVIPATRMNRISSTQNVKTIQVSQAERHRGSDVMVINRAASTNQPIRVADASTTTALAGSDVIAKTTDGVTVISPAVDKPDAAADSAAQPQAASSGPKFVFAN